MSEPRITKEWRLPIGIGPDGKVETMAFAYRVEQQFSEGNVKQWLKLNVTLLNPVIYAQLKPLLQKGSAFIYLEAHDFSKRYKDTTMPAAVATSEATAPGGAAILPPGLASDPDAHVDSDGKDLE